jgi:hypothetical protein
MISIHKAMQEQMNLEKLKEPFVYEAKNNKDILALKMDKQNKKSHGK